MTVSSEQGNRLSHEDITKNISGLSLCSSLSYKRRVAPIFMGVLGVMLLPLSACTPSIGPKNMRRDRIDYDREISRGQKEEMLLNIVALRYADPPTLLQTTQIIAGYTFSKNFMGSIMGDPWNGMGGTNMIGGTAGVSLSDNPTVTYQPVSGPAFASNLLQPISPQALVPVFASSAPIDVIMELAVQSVNSIHNVHGMENERDIVQKDAKRFSFLMKALRRLQIADAINFKEIPAQPAFKNTPAQPEKFYLVFAPTESAEIAALQNQVKQILKLSPNLKEAEIIFANYTTKKNQIAILTRSMMAIYASIAYTIEVPEEAIKDGQTVPTINGRVNNEPPPIIIRCSKDKPSFSDVMVQYEHHWYWISKKDYESKIAFTILQILSALAQNSMASGAMVTIPAR
ncbi:hypothetical protein [Swingsia samuiensis]|uniref:Uncharacterized protein n=1 Tax=Swingsia samuiensis TaxID=1293412 RepID=A0A4Y6ULI8_9PROT|nr:hypothetical protein [Swingsia samuiensis]QDH17326.1 hypothetical protein E3D00_06950 [Swingsia samuiensis]